MRIATLLALGGLLFSCATVPAQPKGKTPPYEEVIVQLIASMEQLTKVLVVVKDLESAEAARPQLKQAAAQFVAVRKKSEQLTQPDKDTKDQIAEKYAKKLADAVQQLRAEVRRVQAIPGTQPVLKELDEALQPPKKNPKTP